MPSGSSDLRRKLNMSPCAASEDSSHCSTPMAAAVLNPVLPPPAPWQPVRGVCQEPGCAMYRDLPHEYAGINGGNRRSMPRYIPGRDSETLMPDTVDLNSGTIERQSQPDKPPAVALRTYTAIRLGVVAVIVALGFAVWREIATSDGHCVQRSLSAYYYTPV